MLRIPPNSPNGMQKSAYPTKASAKLQNSLPYKKGRIFQRNPIFKMPFDPSVRSGQAFFAQGRLAPTPVEGMYHLLHKYRTASPGKGTFKVRRLPLAVGSTRIAVPSIGRIHSVFSVPEAAERSTDTWPP